MITETYCPLGSNDKLKVGSEDLKYLHFTEWPSTDVGADDPNISFPE